MKPGFMIAATSSGSGKTTFARGLMTLLTKKGYKVQPFKCGPDYIDTKFHDMACGRKSINLDTFMASKAHVKALYNHYGADADINVVEGMMGLFDGYDRDLGSSAEIASVIGLPIVLVVDAKSAAYSTAALLSGFMNFKEDVNIAGVLFNKVGSVRHYDMLKQVCSDLGTYCYGYLPNQSSLELNSRYLGLDFSEKAESDTLIQLLEEHVDWKALLKLVPDSSGEDETIYTDFLKRGRVLMAQNNESFSFVYQEKLDGFESVSTFDPETEVPQLENIDLLYLPGGYPEKHAEALSRNEAAREAIKDFAEHGGKIVAECGGMMYLCDKILTDSGDYPMCGVLPYVITSRQQDRKLSLGYRQFTLDGKIYHGHEFHYSQFLGEIPKSVVQVYNAKGEPVSTPVLRIKNVLASYTHIY